MIYVANSWMFAIDVFTLLMVKMLVHNFEKKVTSFGFILNLFGVLFFAFIDLMVDDLVFLLLVLFDWFFMYIAVKLKKRTTIDYEHLSFLTIVIILLFVIFSLTNYLVNVLFLRTKLIASFDPNLLEIELSNKESCLFFVAFSLIALTIIGLMHLVVRHLKIRKRLKQFYLRISELKLENRGFKMVFIFLVYIEVIVSITNAQHITSKIQLMLIIVFVASIVFMVWQVITFAQSFSIKKIAQQELHYAKETNAYLKGIEKQNNEIREFKHDFKNIILSMQESLDNNSSLVLKNYLEELSQQDKFMNKIKEVSFVKINHLKNEAIRSLVVQKFFQAKSKKINLIIETGDNDIELNHSIITIVRILGILLDNAIEYAEEQHLTEIRCAFITFDNIIEISIENQLVDKVEIRKIYEMGYSTKENHDGLGLYNVKRLTNQTDGLYFNVEAKKGRFQTTLVIER
ncbi:sensor histidine kinase [Lentilactobacillus laojiaonis]|uniref:sensor histidine kinase n=1 Tax=Lentilactobacillus laojiaonis TaxID=2883998 RepID=UPI001D09D5A8|nr:GHKL domain-containing protein [Lentilactobacillus laojiaonis]UDM32013.1 GHKL domain-containing protein [Lentilactobacillus laojiaonis]